MTQQGSSLVLAQKKKTKNHTHKKTNPKLGTSLAVQWLRLQVSNVQGVGISS